MSWKCSVCAQQQTASEKVENDFAWTERKSSLERWLFLVRNRERNRGSQRGVNCACDSQRWVWKKNGDGRRATKVFCRRKFSVVFFFCEVAHRSQIGRQYAATATKSKFDFCRLSLRKKSTPFPCRTSRNNLSVACVRACECWSACATAKRTCMHYLIWRHIVVLSQYLGNNQIVFGSYLSSVFDLVQSGLTLCKQRLVSVEPEPDQRWQT